MYIVLVIIEFHVVNCAAGGSKDSGGVRLSADGKNRVLPSQPPSAGAQWFAGGHLYDSTAYAVPKLAEERLAKCLSETNPSKLNAAISSDHCIHAHLALR